MKYVHTFGTDRHKRQLNITFLFEYIWTRAGDVGTQYHKQVVKDQA